MENVAIHFYAPPNSPSLQLTPDGKSPLLAAAGKACDDVLLRPVGYVHQSQYHQLHFLDRLPAELHADGNLDLEFIHPQTFKIGPRMCLLWNRPFADSVLSDQSSLGSSILTTADLTSRCTTQELAQYLLAFALYALPSDGFCWADNEIILQLLEEHFTFDDLKAVAWLTIVGDDFYRNLPSKTRNQFAQSPIPFRPMPADNPKMWYVLFPADSDPLTGPPLDDCTEIRCSVHLEGLSIRGFLTPPLPSPQGST